jgi:hypothetical protein
MKNSHNVRLGQLRRDRWQTVEGTSFVMLSQHMPTKLLSCWHLLGCEVLATRVYDVFRLKWTEGTNAYTFTAGAASPTATIGVSYDMGRCSDIRARCTNGPDVGATTTTPMPVAASTVI